MADPISAIVVAAVLIPTYTYSAYTLANEMEKNKEIRNKGYMPMCKGKFKIFTIGDKDNYELSEYHTNRVEHFQ